MGQSVLAWSLFAYFIAAIPMGVVVGRLRGIDIRRVGSGNIGATNATRVLGARWGVVVFVLAVFKAFLPVWLAMSQDALGGLPDPAPALAWVAFAATLGHIFPVYLGFRGGKGVACALGVFSALLPWAGLLAAVLYAQTLALTRVSAIGSLTAVNAAALHILITDAPAAYKWLVVAIAALIWVRHRGNLREISRIAAAQRKQPRTS